MSGDWNANSTWETYNGSSWIAATATPTSADNLITIRNGHTVTVSASVTIDQTVIEPTAQLKINNGQILTVNDGTNFDLDVFGTVLCQGGWSFNTGSTWKVESGGIYIHNTISSVSPALDAVTLDNNSTFEYRDATLPIISGRTYGNLKLMTSSTLTTTTAGGANTFTVNGTFTIGSGYTWKLMPGFTGRLVTNGDIVIDGAWILGRNDTVQSGKTMVINGTLRDTVDAIIISGDGNFTLSGGAILKTRHPNGVNGMITVSGTKSFSTDAEYEFSGSDGQSVGTNMPETIKGLTINNTSGVTLSQNTTINNTLTLTNGLLDNNTDTLTLADGVEVTVSNGSLSAEPVFSATIDLKYKGTSAVTTGFELPTSPTVLRELTINNSGGVTLSADVTVNKQLYLTTGILNTGANKLSIADSMMINREAGSISSVPVFKGVASIWYSGTIPVVTNNELPTTPGILWNLTVNNQGGVTLASDVTIKNKLSLLSGTLNCDSKSIFFNSSGIPLVIAGGSFVPGTGTVWYNSTTSTFVTTATYNNLELNGPVVYTMAGSFSVKNLTVSAGATLDPGSKITGSDALTLNGILLVKAPTFDDNYAGFATYTFHSGSQVKYVGTEVQTIKGFDYYHLMLYNTNGGSLGGSTTVNGFLTLTSGLLNIGSNSLTIVNRIAGTPANLRSDNTSSLVIEGNGTYINIPSSITDLNNLTLNNINGATLNSNVTIYGTASITSGRLRTVTNKLIIANTGTLSEVGSGNYVLGSVSATRSINSTGNETFGGIGLELNPTAGPFAGSTTVNRTTGTALYGGLNLSGIRRFFNINATKPNGLNLTMVFHYNDAPEELNGKDENKLYLFRSPTGSAPWRDMGFTSRDPLANTITLGNVTDLSTWTASDSANRIARPSSWNSDVVAVPGSETVTISSLMNDPPHLTSTTGTQVWQFDVRDGGNNAPDLDSLPLILNSVKLTQGLGNKIGNWSNAVLAADLFSGSTHIDTGIVNATSISFNHIRLTVPDNGSRRLSMRLSLKKPLGDGVADNQSFVFQVTDENVTTLPNPSLSSGFGAFTAINSDSTKNKIAVDVTELHFTVQPPQTYPIAVNFSSAVSGVDVNNNIDADYAGTINLSRISGTGTLSAVSGLSKAAVSGTASWSDLQYNTIEQGVRFRATDGSYTPDTSVIINFTERVSVASDIITNNGEAATISSIINTPSPLDISHGTQVWSIKIRDGGASGSDEDTYPTILTSLKLTQNGSNTVSVWSDVILAVDLFNGSTHLASGVIGSTDILFNAMSATAPDDGTLDLTLRLSLKNQLPSGTDGKKIVFNILPANIISQNTLSSFFNLTASIASSNASKNIIDVTAAKLLFISTIPNQTIYTDFAVSVGTTDINDNIDLDFGGVVTLAKASGPGALTGNTTPTAVNGVATTTNLKLDESGYYTLSATSGALTAALSNIFAVEGGLTTMRGVVNTNWNMVSVPLTVADFRKAVLFQNAISDAFAYEDVYVQKDTLKNGIGYWLKYAEQETVAIYGNTLTSSSIDVKPGWNMIGSIGLPIPVSAITQIPTGIVVSDYFGYTEQYTQADTIFPMMGYWIKTNAEGQLVLSTSGSVKKSGKSVNSLQQFNILTIMDAAGNKRSLHFGVDKDGKFPIERYELPPIPPADVFDARFTSQKYVAVYPEIFKDALTCPLAIQAMSYPLTISWQIISNEDKKFMLTTLNGDDLLKQTLQGKGTITISEEIANNLALRIAGREILPREFALGNNYPNPFNPSTKFVINVPWSTQVEIIVYDILGRRVKTLMNEEKSAGYHTIEWTGRDDDNNAVSSGIYFVRMVSEKFSAVRKLLLVK